MPEAAIPWRREAKPRRRRARGAHPSGILGEELSIGLNGIMHFNKKADVSNAMLRIADSLAYVAAARHVYVVVDDAENGEATAR